MRNLTQTEIFTTSGGTSRITTLPEVISVIDGNMPTVDGNHHFDTANVNAIIDGGGVSPQIARIATLR